MFLIRRPSLNEIKKFVRASRELPLSYDAFEHGEEPVPGLRIDEASASIGRGEEAFERARIALANWRHFELGWVELFPCDAPIDANTVVAVLVRHLGFWSLNGCRVLYQTGDRDAGSKFGFAYGTLTNHAEMGEELFEVEMDSQTGEVTYRIQAASKPRSLLIHVGYPVTRSFQARFRRDSIAAMQRAVRV